VEASVDDSGTLSYQWYKNTSNSNSGGSAIYRATTTSYTPPTDTLGIVYYYVVITNSIVNNWDDGNKVVSLSSDTAEITVNKINAQTPEISVQPQGAAYFKGANASALSVSASVDDGGTLSYRWYQTTTESNLYGTVIIGATGASYSPPTDTLGTTYYYAVVTNTIADNGDGVTKPAFVISNTAKIVVNDKVNARVPVINNQPQDAVYIYDTNAVPLTVSASASDGGTLSYQWYRNTTGSNIYGTVIIGATGASYRPPTNTLETQYYYAEVTNTIADNRDGGTKTASVKSNAAKIWGIRLNLPQLGIKPVKGQAPLYPELTTTQYTGTLVWQKADGSSFNGNFAASTAYMAVITLAAKTGYSFSGLAANSFSHSEATATNAVVNSATLTITILFPVTAAPDEDTVIDTLPLMSLVTAPEKGRAPLHPAIDTTQYTGTIAWQKENGTSFSGNFAASTVYKAVVALTAKTGFTFTGVAANSFRYDRATVTNAANSGTITILFPITADLAPISGLSVSPGNGTVELSWIDPAETDLASIEISWNSVSRTVSKSSASNRANSATITGLTNGAAYTFTLKAVDNAGIKSAGVSSSPQTPLHPPTGLIRVQFTGPQDETIDLIQTGGPLSWTDNDSLNMSVNGSFTVYRWDLDGVTLPGTNNSLTLYARDLSIKQHRLTVFVTKGGLEYTKVAIFKVEP
jgi:quinol monooxygenase YgiN